MQGEADSTRNWRRHLGWLVGQLLVIFAGVTAAFVVDSYRESRNQAADFREAIAGVIAELARSEVRTKEFADAFNLKIDEWEKADRAGQRAVPGYFRIPGATHPPSPAWTTMVSSGLSRFLEPKLRTELGYHYSEFIGIHDNYSRYNEFTEREVLPRVLQGPDAFYGADGRILPMFKVHMDLQKDFAADLIKLGASAHDLRLRLEALPRSR